LSITAKYTHELGFQYLFDSILIKNADKNRLQGKLDIPVNENISFSIFMTSETQFLRDFDILISDSTGLQRIVNSTFLSPLYCILSIGFDYLKPKLGRFHLGLSSAKLTYLSKPEIIEESGKDELFGISKGSNTLMEYGLSSNLEFDRKLGKLIRWKCDIQAFKSYQLPIDLNVTNSISLKATKHLKTSIRTRLLYSSDIGKKYSLENIITVGFYYDL